MDKAWSGLRPYPLGTRFLKTTDRRSARLPGSTQISRHPNSAPGHPKVRASPSSESSIPGACSPAAARISTNPSPNTRICGRGCGQAGAMIAGPAATAVCSHHPRAKSQGRGPAPAPAFRGGALASARPLLCGAQSRPLTSHSFSTVSPNV